MVQVVVNGVTTTLTYNSTSGRYEGTLTAPDATSGSNNSGQGPGVGPNAQNGYYPVTVIATDDAGNVTQEDVTGSFANSLKLYVLEKTVPTGAIQYPANGANIGNNSQPTIQFTFTDTGSGINPSTVQITVDNTDYSPDSATFDQSGEVLSCEFTPASALADGPHTIEINATDYDGNSAVAVTSTFRIDTTPPTLNVTSPTDNLLTNQTTLNVVGMTNDAYSTPVTVEITVGSNVYTPTVGQDGAFTQAVTLADGVNTITVKATDSSGLITTVTRTVTVDSTPPTIVSITLTPSTVDASGAYTIEVEVTDA